MNNFIKGHVGSARRSQIIGTVLVITLVFSVVGIPSAFALISSQLELGDRGAEVTELQTFLATDANIYPEGLVTGYFGQLTKAAVERYQTSQGIISQGTPATTGYGRVGPRTMLSINSRLTQGDVYAPAITSVSVNKSTTGATIGWTASESARGKVYYSTSPIRLSNIFDVTGVSSGEPSVTGNLAPYDGIARVSHSVNISGLATNTPYYYLVEVLDSSNNVSITLPNFFRTNQ